MAPAVPLRETLIPESANLVIDAEIAAILESEIVMTAQEAMLDSDGSGEGFLVEFKSQLGLDLGSIEFVEAFVDLEALLVSGVSTEGLSEIAFPTFGAALRGEFDEDDFLEKVRIGANGDFKSEPYRGRQLNIGISDGTDASAFTFLDDGTLLLGTPDGVKAMIDVADGFSPPMSGAGMRAVNSLGERHVGVILHTPPELFEMMVEGGQEVVPMLGLLDPTAVSSPLMVLKMWMADSTIEIGVKQYFEEEADAVASKEYTEGTMAMLGALVGSPALQELIAGVEVEQDGLEVTSKLAITDDQLEGILEFLKGMTALQSPDVES